MIATTLKRTVHYILHLLLLACGGVSAQNIATVNGKPVPQARVDALLESMARGGAPDSAETRTKARDRAVLMEILSQEAERTLATDAGVRSRLEHQLSSVKVRVLTDIYRKKHNLPEPNPGAIFRFPDAIARTIKAPNPICPPLMRTQGAGIFAGSNTRPISRMRGQIATLSDSGRPTPVAKFAGSIELRDVYFAGQASGPFVLPDQGSVGSVLIRNTALTLHNGNLQTSCIETEVGPMLLLFDASPTSMPSATLVVSKEQAEKLSR